MRPVAAMGAGGGIDGRGVAEVTPRTYLAAVTGG